MKQKFIILFLIFSIILGGVQLVSAEVPENPDSIELTATPGNNQVTLEWDKVEGATHYLVGRSTTPGESSLIISDPLEPTTLSYTDSTVENGVTYYYTIWAVIDSQSLQPSNEVSITPQATSEPHQVRVVASDSQVTLEWDMVEDATHYLVGRSTTPGESS
ncbi:hypothetical protein WAK64_10810, partial [Bacillus spongiae]